MMIGQDDKSELDTFDHKHPHRRTHLSVRVVGLMPATLSLGAESVSTWPRWVCCRLRRIRLPVTTAVRWKILF